MKEVLIRVLTSEYVLGLIASGIGALVVYINRKKASSEEAAKREDLVEKGAAFAYSIVNDIAKQTPNTVDDKVALGLEKFVEYLRTHKVEPTPVEVERAKLVFSAFHGEGK